MYRKSYNKALSEYKRLKQEIEHLMDGRVGSSMKIIVGSNKPSYIVFDLRELNRDIIIKNH